MTKRNSRVLYDIKIYHYMMQQHGWKCVEDIRTYLGYPKGKWDDAKSQRIRRFMKVLVELNLVREEREKADPLGKGAERLYWRKIF